MSQSDRAELTDCLVAWRTARLRDRQVIDAVVHPDHRGPSPALAAALARWPGTAYWSDEPDGRHLVLTRTLPRPRERWALHAALLVATLLTTTWAGAVFAGAFEAGAAPGLGADTLLAWSAGLPFSLPLLAILLAHELGHYVTARRYGLDASPPYFLPLPQWPWLIGIGTLGAFIRLRTIVSDRRQLLDVGVGGPLAGFVVALPVLALGLAWSEPVAADVALRGMVVWFGTVPAELGDSLLTLGLRALLGNDAAAVELHPLAFAGWVGLLVTMFNLLPIGQLDGGHILCAVAPRWHPRVGLVVWILLLALGLLGWRGWLVWAALVMAVSRGRVGHPPVLDGMRPLPRSRTPLALASLVLFALTFMPVPFRI